MDTNFKNDLKYVNRVRGQMNENQLMLCYRGEMSQEIVMALLNLTENKLNQTIFDSPIKTRVFSVMVECLQNITQQSKESVHAKSNLFMVGYAEHGYIVYSGNVIKKENVEELRTRILEINTMTEEELKEFYKYLIKNENLSGKSGFGLGLIHIARKTGNALDFDFEQIDTDHYFFSLSTLVDH
jgi:hypothetical protein